MSDGFPIERPPGWAQPGARLDPMFAPGSAGQVGTAPGTPPFRPVLIVVSGPPGAGKTTLARQVARAVGCPAVCRDEIKEGMAHASPGFAPGEGDELTMRALPVFFGVLWLLLEAGVTTVAEAAFQDR